MVNIIQTAIITIIISFISGLLLEYYKNLAPRILCDLGNAVPMKMNNKKNYAYILTVKNISNKIIHEITLNVQSSQSNLKIENARITKGLKFDSSIKDNILDVDIPFLSKNDKFSVKLYVENEYGEHNKPVVIIRSPENFKQVNSIEQNGVLSSLSNVPKNIYNVVSKIMKKNETIAYNEKGDFTKVMNKAPGIEKTINKENGKILHINKKFRKNKMAMIIIAFIILVISVGSLEKFYFKEVPTSSAQTLNENKQSTDESGSAGETNKNTDTKASTGGKIKNAGSKTPTDETNKNANTITSIDGTNKNTDTKPAADGATKNADTKTPADGATKNADTKPAAADGITKNADTKTPADGTTKNADTKASTSGTTKNTDTKTQTSGTNSNTGN